MADLPGAERPFPGLARIPLRTPTLPPATTTNHYLVGSIASVLVDPATPHRGRQRQLIAVVEAWQAAVAPLRAIVLTHHHNDHIGAATVIAAHFGVPIMAHEATAELLAGRVAVTDLIRDGDVIAHDVEGPWVALHTPGHAPGHLVLQGPHRGMVAGDMVAGEGTILIDPQDGHMGEYLTSLRRMRAASPTWLAPAHGPILRDADDTLHHYLTHRLAREGRIFAALGADYQAADALLPEAYGDVSRAVWPLALRAMRAHLIELHRQGRVHTNERGHWRRSREAS